MALPATAANVVSLRIGWPAMSATSGLTVAARTRWEIGPQPRDQRQDCPVKGLRCYRTNLLEGDPASCIDDKGLRHAVNPPVDRDPPADVGPSAGIRITHPIEPAGRIIGLVLVIEAMDWDRVLRFQPHQHGMLLAARDAPGCEDVDQRNLAFQIARR